MVTLEDAVFAGVTGLFALAGVWVLAARPQERQNQYFAAVLFLLAGSSVAFAAYRAATLPEDRLAFLRIVFWYEIPLTFLLLVVLDRLFLPRPRTPARTAALALAGLGSVGLAAALVAAPDLFSPGFRGIIPIGGPLGLLQQGSLFLVETLAVVLAARAVRSPESGPLQRRQAAVLGLGFAALIIHAGGSSVRGLFLGPLAENWPLVVASVVELLVVLACLPTLVRVFEGRWRTLATAVALVPFVGLAYETLGVTGVLPPAWVYRSGTRPLWQGFFALCLAYAVVRYGFAGVVPDARRQVARVSGFAIALGAVAIGVAVGLEAFGPTPLVLGVAAVGLVAGPVLLLKTPLREVPGRFAERVVLDAAEPDVAAERLRVYLAAMRAARAPDGTFTPGGERVLRDLRAELHITPADHAVLSELLDQPRQRGEAGSLLFGRYALERDLGRGGSGVVTLARDIVIGRHVVIKRLDAGGKPEHLLAEMRALGRLNHPRVLTLYHAEQVGGAVFLVLEHAPGGSLAARLEQQGPLSVPEALAVVEDVLEALDAVHGAGFVHGDVKVGNVLLAADGRAKLADFGATRARRNPADPDATVKLPDSTATIGSASPEQLRGERISPASDVYSAGVLLFRLLTGEHYLDFQGLSEADAMQRAQHAPPRLPHPKVPARVEAVLAKALAKDPAQRHASPAELRAALAAVPRKGRATAAAPR